MKDFISHVGNKYDEKREELKQKAKNDVPNEDKFVRYYIYKNGEFLDKFFLNEYERYIEKYVDFKKYTNQNLMRNQFPEAVQMSGYTIGVERDDERWQPRWKEYTDKIDKLTRELISDFKKELFEHYGVSDLEEELKERIYSFCYMAAKDGGYFFIELHFVQLLDLMGLREDTNPEIVEKEVK